MRYRSYKTYQEKKRKISGKKVVGIDRSGIREA